MLRGKTIGWSVSFPMTLQLILTQLIKPKKDNSVKKKHESSSQQDPVYQNTARTA